MTLEAAIQTAQSYSSDSRILRSGEIFVALKGEKGDGHNFVPEILKRSEVVAVVVHKSYQSPVGDPRLIFVEDSHQAHRQLAHAFRKKFAGKIVAVGGSNGKTSTKEFLATLLAEKFTIIKTDKSQNGELGIPKTLEKLRSGVEVAVVEVGIDGPGDMARHAALLMPDVAVLTSIGEEHLNLLKNVENVFSEEKILFSATPHQINFAPAGDPYLQRLKGATNLQYSPTKPTDVNTSFKISADFPPIAQQNAALAVTVAKHLGLSDAEIARGLTQLQIPEGRGLRLNLKSGAIVLADHYNANTSSMRFGLQHAVSVAKNEGRPLRVLLGDMLDLGDAAAQAHASLLPDVFALNAQAVAFIGPQWAALAPQITAKIPDAQFFHNSQATTPLCEKWSQERVVIFLKGSNGMKLDHAYQIFKKLI